MLLGRSRFLAGSIPKRTYRALLKSLLAELPVKLNDEKMFEQTAFGAACVTYVLRG